MIRPAGLEPATYGLEIRCSIQLSYERGKANVLSVHISPDLVLTVSVAAV